MSAHVLYEARDNPRTLADIICEYRPQPGVSALARPRYNSSPVSPLPDIDPANGETLL